MQDLPHVSLAIAGAEWGLIVCRKSHTIPWSGLDAAEMDGHHWTRYVQNRVADGEKAKLRNCGNKSPGIPIVRHPESSCWPHDNLPSRAPHVRIGVD